MKTLFSLKRFSGSPSDSVDNIFKSVFSRIPASEITLLAAEDPSQKRLSLFLQGSWDALWGVGTVPDIPWILLRPRTKCYILNFHSILIRGKDGPWQPKTPWFLRRFIFSRADLIITPSEFSANTVRRYFPKKRVVGILNGVDLQLFNPSKKNPELLRMKYNISGEKPLVVFVGTLQARKRPDVFIEVARNFPEAHFVAVGKSYEGHDFLSAAAGLKNFQWISAMPREDIAVLLASSCAFLFPSLNEPAAAVILESMASGTVPILSASGGNGEFLKDGESGFLIAPDGDEIARVVEKLRSLLMNPARRDAFAAAARREAERHSFDGVAEQYKKTILSLWNSR